MQDRSWFCKPLVGGFRRLGCRISSRLFRVLVNELARRAEPSRADLGEEYRRVVDVALENAAR